LEQGGVNELMDFFHHAPGIINQDSSTGMRFTKTFLRMLPVVEA